MSTTEKSFESWAVVEIMGHQRYAGYVTEQTLGGASFVRLDVPASDGVEAFTKMFGAGSIYCITPCTEETARAFAAKLKLRAFNIYEAPRLVAAGSVAAPASGDDDDDTDTYDDADDGWEP